jgi:hypothetical protein
MPRLYCYEGATSSVRAALVLSERGVQFDRVSIHGDARSLSDLYDSVGVSRLPTLTVFGARYEGLPAIEAFAKKEAESR